VQAKATGDLNCQRKARGGKRDTLRGGGRTGGERIEGGEKLPRKRDCKA